MDFEVLKTRAISGAISLTARRILLQAISFLTINIVLARILPVATLGVFNIGTSVISFFAFFADIGLAAAIIQKKGEVTGDDLKTTFTIQQILVLVVVVIIFLAAPFLAELYKIGDQGVWLIRALAVSFFITSFKVIPAVLLERDLKFNPLVSVEIIETLTFNLGLIILVSLGGDLNAFSLSALARSLVGVAVIYIIAPWKIGLGIIRSSAKKLLEFGIPFQVNSLLALLKDRLVPLVIAKIVGPAGIGYITWAQNLAFLPLEVMNIIIRVSFPTLSRLQEDKNALKQVVERSLFVTTLFLYPVLFGMLALAPSLVEHVVSHKWAPALPAFYLFSISTFWATLSTTFTNALNAIGQIKITLKLMVFWTVITWILTPILTINFGFLGVAIASSLISFTSIITIIIVKKMLTISVLENIWQPLVSSILMWMVMFSAATFFVKDAITLFLMIILGGMIYWGIISLLARAKLQSVLKDFRNAFHF